MFGSLIPWTTGSPRTLSRIEDDMNRLIERFFGPYENGWPTTAGFLARANVAETDDGFEVSVELPGMSVEDFNVELHNGELTISGEKKEEKEEKGKTFHRVERRCGQFRRSFSLPNTVSEDKVEAEYKDGVLRVWVPKVPAAKPKTIAVKAAG